MGVVVYSDGLIAVETGVDLSAIGTSFTQELKDGITIKINSPSARVIQFKARYAKWLEGPDLKGFVPDVPGYSMDKGNLDWAVDSASFPIPYYDEGGACKKTLTDVTIGDQPDVHPMGPENKALYFDDSLKLEEMPQYNVKEVFVGASVVIVNNCVERVVYWKRRGVPGAAEYKLVGVLSTKVLDERWKNVLKKDGYEVPKLG